MLINYTNHPSKDWSREQTIAAKENYEEILDIPFLNVVPSWTEEDIYRVACEEYKKIVEEIGEDKLQDKKTAVLCQGEFTLSFLIIKFLMSRNIKVISTVSNRIVEEKIEDGISKKVTIFKFLGFRAYDSRNCPNED